MIGVFGPQGLLGNTLITRWPEIFDPLYGDIRHQGFIDNVLSQFDGDVVVNCAGVVPKAVGNGWRTIEDLRLINGVAPHFIARSCDMYSKRLIQISTDCVFSGEVRGNNLYTEKTTPSPTDMYGISKVVGEITQEPHLTIRTSFVGLPDPRGRGLLAWLIDRTPDQITEGWTRHFWGGVTTLTLGKWIKNLAFTDVTGIFHVSGQRISKYDLLQTAVDELGLSIKLVKNNQIKEIDRSLQTERWDVENKYRPPASLNFREQMKELVKWYSHQKI